jgi:outer membrane protein assembly factor BamB
LDHNDQVTIELATRRPVPWFTALIIAVSLAATACGPSGSAGAARRAPAPSRVGSPTAGEDANPASAPWNDPATATGSGSLAAGSDPSVLPGDLMIADKKNNRLVIVDPQGRLRWQFPGQGDLAPGQTFRIPDDAFFSPDGRFIVATEEDDFVISVIDIARHRIVYRYGTAGHSGAGANQLDNPDDAMMLTDGYLISPDIKNCRILLIPPGAHAPATVFGRSMQSCQHQPPARFGSPNGAFPMTNGDFLITEIRGSWVDEMSLAGQVLWSTHPPGVSYPSDTNEIGPDRYLTVDYSSPGQVVIFDKTGRMLWRYRPSGPAELRNPSLALPLPNGDIVVSDDFNHRVIVVDPRTGTLVWQYGHTGVASAANGYLDNPDAIDLVPPYSLLTTHAATLGHP